MGFFERLIISKMSDEGGISLVTLAADAMRQKARTWFIRAVAKRICAVGTTRDQCVAYFMFDDDEAVYDIVNCIYEILKPVHRNSYAWPWMRIEYNLKYKVAMDTSLLFSGLENSREFEAFIEKTLDMWYKYCHLEEHNPKPNVDCNDEMWTWSFPYFYAPVA